MTKISKSEVEWKKQLTDEEFHVTRQQGTEAPFSGQYVNTKEKGVYKCVCCGNVLFKSDDKFDSGTGWPSFTKPIDESILEHNDNTHFMQRIEVTCDKCGAHLGHVFDDGPKPTGQRYCINSCALKLDKE